MIDLSGTILPVTTPFDPVTGDVDLVAYRANLRHWLAEPVRGILIAGSTGESVLLDESERTALVEASRDVVPEDRLVIAGTGAESTRQTIRLTKEAARAGADAVLVQPPAFFKGAMTPDALARHYRAVADASAVPVIIYQVPLRLSTIEFSNGLIAELSHHPVIVGIKDSRGSLHLVGDLLTQCTAGFQVLIGDGAILYGALETGAVGGILGVGLLASADAAEICVAFNEGRTSDAGAAQERIAPLHKEIVGRMGVPGIKAALDVLGLHGGAPRPPLAPLPEGRVAELRSLLGHAGLLQKAAAG